MKRAILSSALLAAVAIGLTSCGGGSSPSNEPQTSKIKTRAFVTNAFSGLVDIVDYSKDLQSFFTINVGSQPQFMVPSKDRKLMLTFDASNNTVVAVDTATEKVVGGVTLPNWTESIVISADLKNAWAAIPNASVTGAPQTGSIQPIDMTNWTLGTPIAVPLARHVVMNNAGNKLLVFSDANSQVAKPISVVDITDPTKAAVTVGVAAGTGVDRPIWGAFGSDDNKPFILNCGRECGGTAASVSVIDMTAGTVIPGSTVSVVAGSQLLLDGNNLYVAGSDPSSGNGSLTALTINGTTLAASQPVAIGDGFHTVMLKATNSKILIGANPCTNVGVAGCLTIYDSAARTAVIAPAKGFVTGMAQVPNRNVVYVAEGGELKIYDTTTSAEFTGRFIDVIGNVTDVKIADQ